MINGELGQIYRGILSRSCAPIYWYQRRDSRADILNSGTVTFVRTPNRLMAITAAHVVRCFEKAHAAATWPLHLQVADAALNLEVIDISDELDLATLAIDDALLSDSERKSIRCRVGHRAYRKRGVVSCSQDTLPLIG